MKKTIEQFENQLTQALQAGLRSVAPGYEPQVTLYEKGRKKRRSASAEHWSPESGEIRIGFRQQGAASSSASKAGAGPSPEVVQGPASPAPSSTSASGPLHDLIRALKRAESRPGYDFIALKWFRDTHLPAEGFEWTTSDSMRQEVLRKAIEERLILTSKVANPKSPQFPVTAIRLNRSLPQVAAILGEEQPAQADFAPVEIGGDSLSSTILGERR
jgi:hypothetical protein